MAIRSRRHRHAKKMKVVYQSPTPHARTTTAEIPVFMLPQEELAMIPEEAEMHEGFLFNLALPPHRNRFFTGLVSISNPDKTAIERSATNSVIFGSYSFAKTQPIPARAA